ncbi:hypothetical protein HPP92_023428 [Vanilla planifolia]|uniref:Uncharacterized protein n=1 Tax=Vanilla planifolia TaxID=51239 RepID=A0A835PQB5_VANPL|nr:hypothetical protein HPP92_023428 [Vanilla planifolia]
MALLRCCLQNFALQPSLIYGASALSLRSSAHIGGDATYPRLGWKPMVIKRQNLRRGNACNAASFSPHTLQWVSAVSSAVLMFTKGTAIQKSFLVPLFVLQAPPTVISWIKGRYGAWAAFLALLVRIFYVIPGELELPFLIMLLVISAPYEAINLRGSQAGVIISLGISLYLTFQHFSRLGRLSKAFDQASFIASSAIICITAGNKDFKDVSFIECKLVGKYEHPLVNNQ